MKENTNDKTEEKKRKKRRIVKAALISFTLAIFGALALLSAFVPMSAWKYYVGLPKLSKRAEGELRVHFLDVGQGDCTVLEFPDGKTMLIDAGDGSEENNRKILRYLNALKIDRLDYALLTHPDIEHCGGMANVLKLKKPRTLYAPAISDYTINAEYAAFYAAMKGCDGAIKASCRGEQIVGEKGYALTFLSPYHAGNPDGVYDKINGGKYTAKDIDDSSAVVWLDYFGSSILFTGDSTSEVEKTLMRDDGVGAFDKYGVRLSQTEILKVSSHGSAEGTSVEFSEYLNVKDGVISLGKSPLGVPAANTLKRVNANVLRTDERGDIIAALCPDGSYRFE